MNIIPTVLPDVKLIEPKIFKDERGIFFECYNQRDLSQWGLNAAFVQDNYSWSHQHVLRGLHYQLQQTQGKLVQVLFGKVFDVVVDIRRHSTTFGKWASVILSDARPQLLWIPEGFAHGFLVLSDQAGFHYKTTHFYDPHSERCLKWDDPDLAIDWPLTRAPLLSEKDSKGELFKNADLLP